MAKYEIDSSETQSQPGSNNAVMLNKLGIIDIKEMNDVETILLTKLYKDVFSTHTLEIQVFTFGNIATWHRRWLGNVYEWAGKIRNVNMSKAGFTFAAATQISRCLESFETDYLSRLPNLQNLSKEEFISFLARSHAEFILIHPFREGNGRIGRLLMDYAYNQVESSILDHSLWDKEKEFYIKSIQAAHGGDYQHIERLVRDIVH